MGRLFEELIRRFSEVSNETAGEHFTPREVIRLIVDLVIATDDTKLMGSGVIRLVYDPACGTGGMLTIAEEALKGFNHRMRVELFGQEINSESFAVCKSDMLVTGHDPEQIAFGNTLTDDKFKDSKFHYMVSNPPYGVDWKKYRVAIEQESVRLGFDGRFGAGMPRVSDGQLLFLQHMISKMRDDEVGSRIGIVMNGSPLFTGGAGSGESEIRRWIFENDWVEAIVGLPTDLFYNTGIQTYVWLLTNRKRPLRRGKVQLIDASGERFWQAMRKSLGSKRREIPESARDEVVRLFAGFADSESSKDEASHICDTRELGYREIRVERPLRMNFCACAERIARLEDQKSFVHLDEGKQERIREVLKELGDVEYSNREVFDVLVTKRLNGANLRLNATVKKAVMNALAVRDENADICTDQSGQFEPDPELRDYERVPLSEDWREYMKREVEPFVTDAWVDEEYIDSQDKRVGRVGYEINFNRYFYRYVPPRSISAISNELKELESEIKNLLQKVVR